MRRIILILILFSIIPVLSYPVVNAQDDPYLTITVDRTISNYRGWLQFYGDDLGLAWIGGVVYYYTPSYFDFSSFNITGTNESYVQLVFTYIYGGYPVFGFEVIIDHGSITVDDNVITTNTPWFIVQYIVINTTDKQLNIYYEGGSYSLYIKGFNVMLCKSENIELTIKESQFKVIFIQLSNTRQSSIYRDLIVYTDQHIVYFTFEGDTVQYVALNYKTGYYLYVNASAYGPIAGINYLPTGLLVVYKNGSKWYSFVTIGKHTYGVYTILGETFIPVPGGPIQVPELPEKPEIPNVPSPPDWYNVPGWVNYAKDRVIDFFTKVVPSSLSFLSYLLGIGSGIFAILGIITVIFSLIIVGVPAVLGVMTMIYMIHGDFHEITKMWLWYIDFIRKIFEFMIKVFKAIINVILKVVDIIGGPAT